MAPANAGEKGEDEMITTSRLVDLVNDRAESVVLKCPPLGIDTTRVIVEGDIGLTDVGVLEYAARRIEIAEAVSADPGAEKQGLLGIERDGRTLRWRPGTTLTYVVYRPSFANDAEYQAVVDCMAAATADWQSICGVEFEHVADRDADPDLEAGEVTFPVLRGLDGGRTIALAFFPDDPVDQRAVWAFDGFFDADGAFDPIGVMRHELGHVLGFRHEHIRPEAPDLFDPESLEHTVEITEYEPTSVMHYLGPGVGDSRLRFTGNDRAGARHVYGGPHSEFSYAG
jgi:hypothetical protein